MFVGHYAAALAAKAVEPKAPLWVYVAGAQLVDIGWSVLIMAGIERVGVDPALPGSPFELSHMPYTHSLPATALWALAAVLLCRWVLKFGLGASVMVGVVVASHWGLDWLAHRPDLELWFGGPKVGLGLWNQPVLEQVVEMGLVLLAGAAWAWRRGAKGRSPAATLLFLAALVGLQISLVLIPVPTDPLRIGLSALAVYLAAAALAWAVDRGSGRDLA